MDDHRQYGVNVKSHRVLYPEFRWPENVSEAKAEAILEGIQDNIMYRFWTFDVQDAAREYGFDEVFSEGRMGGWAVPEPRIDPDSPADVERLEKFAQRCAALVTACEEAMIEEGQEALDKAEREPALRAEAAARDIETA